MVSSGSSSRTPSTSIGFWAPREIPFPESHAPSLSSELECPLLPWCEAIGDTIARDTNIVTGVDNYRPACPTRMNIDLSKSCSRFCAAWEMAEMISPERRNLPVPHLKAAAAAMAIIGSILLCGVCVADYVELRSIHVLAMESSYLKDQGVAWQRAVFAEPDLLPFYGSSELLQHFCNEPQHFFGSYPTNFAVSPSGRGGCTSLIQWKKLPLLGLKHAATSSSYVFHPVGFFTHALLTDGMRAVFRPSRRINLYSVND